MTEQQKHMLQQALEALIEDVLALEEGEPEERPITAEDILGICINEAKK